LFVVIVVLIIVVIMWSVLFPKQTEKGKNRKKKVLTMSIFKPSLLYIIHTTHEKRD